MTRGWDPRRQIFVHAFGSDALEGSGLLTPLVFFMAPNDQRMLSTVDAIRRPTASGGPAEDGLVYPTISRPLRLEPVESAQAARSTANSDHTRRAWQASGGT
jgi:hypothetical protein